MISFLYQVLFWMLSFLLPHLLLRTVLRDGHYRHDSGKRPGFEDYTMLSASQLLNGGKGFRPICVTASLMIFSIFLGLGFRTLYKNVELYIKVF